MIIVLLLALHAACAVVWVGGMFFALMVLRPASDGLAAPQRLQLWRQVFGRFFLWVWVAVIGLLVSGYWMLLYYFGGFQGAGIYIHLMNGTGLLMMGLYAWLYFVLWPRFRRAVDAADFESAPRRLAAIRTIVLINLVIGLLTVIIGAAGPWFTAYG